jgi:hypothetical protein
MAIETGTESIARRDGRGIRPGTGCWSSEDDEARALTAMRPPIDATTEAMAYRKSVENVDNSSTFVDF